MDVTIEKLLASYPRRRPPLPEPYRRIYDREYQGNRTGACLSTRLTLALERWMHKVISADAKPGSILELGAGTLNHVPFENCENYDVVEPFELLYRDSLLRARLRRIFRDISEVPDTARYDRVISIAVLEHIEELPQVLATSALHLAPGGIFQHCIPSEGGALWGLGWRLTTGLSYRLRNHLSYGRLMRWEHINQAHEVAALITWLFGRVATRRFPLPLHHLSFYTYIRASEPNLQRCKSILGADRHPLPC